jgi:nicotinic acid mononucleotide adenylyltransferase
MKKVIKVGVLGGSFDPPTISHLQLCSEVIYVKKFD